MEIDRPHPVGANGEPPRRRGIVLTAWLTFMSIGAVYGAYFAVTETTQILSEQPDAPAFILWTKTMLALLNMALLGGVWGWKRWALYALGLGTFAVFATNTFANGDWLYFMTGLIPYTILFLMIRLGKTWKQFSASVA